MSTTIAERRGPDLLGPVLTDGALALRPSWERPLIDPGLEGWELGVTGLVRRPLRLCWSEFLALPASELTIGARHETRWTRLAARWRGVPFDALLALAEVRPEATHVLCHSEYGFPTTVALADATGTDRSGRPRALPAYEYNGRPLDAEHGFPLRFLVPDLYFWKSALWLAGLELADGHRARSIDPGPARLDR